ncbi:MAG TPA: hypothetical protein VMB20_05100 [Candidatus Acidoferrum sp.]|nr:hypothetical protein [Candidatus Acidoferrum sp.]
MTAQAMRAIVGARLRAERRTLVFACASAAIVGYFATRSLAGPMFFCSTIGIAVALLQGPGRHAYLDTTERSAPLFGRELARAKALAPVISATIATLVYWSAQLVSGFAAPAIFLALSLACVLAATLVTLNATTRNGAGRALAVAFAGATVIVAFLLAKSGDAIGAATSLAFCVLVGFVALRQYGESLARYEAL